MPTYAGEFSQIRLDDAGGTPNDVSVYATDMIDIEDTSDDTDATSFGPAGVATAENHIWGARASTIKIVFLFDPVICKILRQIAGSRTGFTLAVWSGTNAQPTYGDEVYVGEYTLLDVSLNYTPGQPAKITCTFVLADQIGATSAAAVFGVY